MECGVCNVRSSSGFCAECRMLLCDECAAKCERCGKLACPQHVHETSSGRILCGNCKRERDEKKAKVRAIRDAAHDIDEERIPAHLAAGVEDEEEEGEEAVVLTGSVREPTPPWKLSLYTACIALVVALVILFVPGFRSLLQPWPAIMVMVISVLAMGWTVYGVMHGKFITELTRCLAGSLVAILAIILAVVIIVKDPARRVEQEAAAAREQRLHMNSKEREQYRKDRLGQFGRTGGANNNNNRNNRSKTQ